MTTINTIASKILKYLLLNFKEQNLTANDLIKGYVGIKLNELRDSCTDGDPALVVDFDIAMQELEKKKLVQTGPMQFYDNPPRSTTVFLVQYSKREYAYLSDKGYRAAQESEKKSVRQPSMTTHVNISGSHIHQSTIGVGGDVTQSTSMNVQNNLEAVDKLVEILSSHAGDNISDQVRKELGTLVATAHSGDIPATKSMFQTLFGAAKETVKQTAWGILTAILAKQMGL